MILERLRPLGLRFDERLNQRNEMDREIQTEDSSAAIIVVATREDITMVRQAEALLWLREQHEAEAEGQQPPLTPGEGQPAAP
jgi:hypothetical protein